MDSADISIIIAGVSSLIVAVIYSLKHIQKSACCGFKCSQVVLDNNGNVILPKDSIIDIPQNLVLKSTTI
jgi:hypothetical protein